MLIGVTVICCSLLYTILVACIYFPKKKINNVENKIYSFLISISIIGLLLELGCCYFLYNKDISLFYSFLNIVVNKIYLMYLLTWELTFTLYIFFISFNEKKEFRNKLSKNKKGIITLIGFLYVIMIALVIMLPTYYHNDGKYLYSYGPATNLLYIVGGICIAIDNFCLFKNIKNIKNKKYYPLFILVVLMIFVFVIRQINPGLIVINSVFAFVTVMMYFTIENPDAKLINELNENRVLVEKINEEKSNFLFKMTAEVRHPIDYIYETSKSLLNETDSEKLSKGISAINSSSRKVSYLINEVLNVSAMDIKNLKVVNTKYNFYNVISEICARTNNENKKNIEIRYNISSDIPKSLYGDAIKIKQIIMTILSNSIKYTNKGFVELNVSSMIKYDMCRLIISIEDSGVGMNIEQVNDLLELNEELSENDLKTLGKIDLNLNIVKKIVKYLGGTMMIKSEQGKGSEFTVVLDQKIDVKNDEYELEKYKSIISSNTRVLLVHDDIQELSIIGDILKKHNITYTSTMYSRDCIDKINFKTKYDLIIINDEMSEYSALDTLKQLKQIKGFNTPVVVVLDKKKDFIKEHYVKDGFKDYILREQLDREVKRVINKYL